MRTQRYGCIQSDEQLRFSYVAILVATHNLMAEAPIAFVPELVEREKQETTGMKCTVLPRIVFYEGQFYEKYFVNFENINIWRIKLY